MSVNLTPLLIRIVDILRIVQIRLLIWLRGVPLITGLFNLLNRITCMLDIELRDSNACILGTNISLDLWVTYWEVILSLI